MKKLPLPEGVKTTMDLQFYFIRPCRRLLHRSSVHVHLDAVSEYSHRLEITELNVGVHEAVALPHSVKFTVAGVCPLHECPCPVKLDLTVVLALKISHLYEEMFSIMKGLDAAGDERIAHGNGHLCDVTYDFRILLLHVNLLRHSPCCIVID